MEPERFYSAVTEEYDETNDRASLPEAYTELLQGFSDEAGERVLDAGCGPGRDTEYFYEQGHEAVGMDLSAGMIEYAQDNRQGTYVRGDLRDLPFDDGSFDAVWCNAAVFLLEREEMPDAIDELARVTADDGLAHVSFKLGEGTLDKEMDGYTVEQQLVPEDEVRSMLEEAGYEVRSFDRAEMPAGFAFGNYVLER
jgi:ubiquinone/menaquinone biosynthesis C-methylase UbiE